MKLIFLKLAVAITLTISSCGGYYIFPEKKIPDWWENREEATATVYNVDHAPETTFQFSFDVNGKAYKGGHAFYEHIRGVVIGSRYKVTYNPENPEQNKILLHKPVLEDWELVRYTFIDVGPPTGKGIAVIPAAAFGQDSIYIFRGEYSVDGKIYRGVQFYFLNDKGYTPEYINRKRFKLKYWVINPLRSVILLDKPMSD